MPNFQLFSRVIFQEFQMKFLTKDLILKCRNFNSYPVVLLGNNSQGKFLEDSLEERNDSAFPLNIKAPVTLFTPIQIFTRYLLYISGRDLTIRPRTIRPKWSSKSQVRLIQVRLAQVSIVRLGFFNFTLSFFRANYPWANCPVTL